MSKFNIVLKYLKKYIFWVISILCLVVTMVLSSTISGNKAENFKTRESAIEGRFQEMQMLSGQNSPNGVVVAQKKEDVENLKQNIMEAWTTLYEPQSKMFINRWPEFRGDVNAQEYQNALQSVWETQTLYENKNSLASNVADAYRDYVFKAQARDFMERYKIYVPLLTSKDGAAMEMPTTGTEKSTDESTLPSEGNLVWDEVNRMQMRNRFYLLYKPTGTGKANSTRKIMMVQEDIWVYDILLNAIAKMNAHSEGAHDAVIKRIFAVDIAEYASNLYGSADSRSGSSRRDGGMRSTENKAVRFKDSENRAVMVEEAKATGDEDMIGGEAAMMATPDAEDEEGSGMADVEFETLFENRYVDAYGNFMSAVQFSEYLKGKPEYKLMPIHVKVLINQNEIPQFMLNCMNSDMPIFIHQISINSRDYDAIPHLLEIKPEEAVSAEDSGMGGAGTSSRRRPRMNDGMMMEGANPMAMNTEMTNNSMMVAGPDGEKDERKPEDVEFELWGMICIFNKPDVSKFDEIVAESGGSTESEAAEEGEDGEESGDGEESEEDGASEESAEGEESGENTDSKADADAAEEEAALEENSGEDAAVPDTAAADESNSGETGEDANAADSGEAAANEENAEAGETDESAKPAASAKKSKNRKSSKTGDSVESEEAAEPAGDADAAAEAAE